MFYLEIFRQGYESVNYVSIVIVTCLFFLLFVDFYYYIIRIFFIPGYPHNFRYVVIVSFNFTVYDTI